MKASGYGPVALVLKPDAWVVSGHSSFNELVGFTEKDLQALELSYGHRYVAIVKEEGYPVSW